MRRLTSHSSKGEEGLDLFWPLFSYASDADLLRNRKDSLAPKKIEHIAPVQFIAVIIVY